MALPGKPGNPDDNDLLDAYRRLLADIMATPQEAPLIQEPAPVAHIWRLFHIQYETNNLVMSTVEYAAKDQFASIYVPNMLRSRYMMYGIYGRPWETSIMDAMCERDPFSARVPRHLAPDERCECGIYGYYEIGEIWSQQLHHFYEPAPQMMYYQDSSGRRYQTSSGPPVRQIDRGDVVLARCSFWGKTIVGDRGVRTAHAKIEKAYTINNSYGVASRLVQDYPDIEWIDTTPDQVLTMVRG